MYDWHIDSSLFTCHFSSSEIVIFQTFSSFFCSHFGFDENLRERIIVPDPFVVEHHNNRLLQPDMHATTQK